MQIRMLILAAIAAAVITQPSASNAQSMVYGGGNASCGTYISYKNQDAVLYGAAQTWTTGYLTAMGQQLRIADLLAGTDLNGVTAWLDNYCAQNPIESYYTANYQLVIFLARRQAHSN